MVRAIMRMKRPRRYIPLPELLASALADLLPQEQRDDLRAHKVSAKQVIKLFSPDHNHLHSLGGSDAWWNITMMLREPHKEKSKRDTSIVAKSRRIEKEPETLAFAPITRQFPLAERPQIPQSLKNLYISKR